MKKKLTYQVLKVLVVSAKRIKIYSPINYQIKKKDGNIYFCK
jgi:hypothetical protein